jgi:hypothetical protein
VSINGVNPKPPTNTKSKVPTFPSTLKSGKDEPLLVSVGVSQMEQNTKRAKKYRKSSKNQEFAAFLVRENITD